METEKNFSCPICNKRFSAGRGLQTHLMHTKQHEDAVTYIRRLQFLLAEAEDNVKFWRDAKRETSCSNR